MYAELDRLLKNYPTNALFQYFLYPCFEKETLKRLNFWIYLPIVTYLEGVCTLVKYHLSWKDREKNLVDGNMPSPIFSWPKEDPSDYKQVNHKSNWSALKDYLYKEFGWNWIDKARVIPNYIQDNISIRNIESNANATILISRKEKRVTGIISKLVSIGATL